MITSAAAEIYDDDNIFSLKEDEHVEKLLLVVEVQRWTNETYSQGRHHQEEEVREYINGFSKEQAKRRIRDLKTLELISRMFGQLLYHNSSTWSQRMQARKTNDYAIPQSVVEREGLELTHAEYLNYCEKQFYKFTAMLRSLYDLTMETHRNIIDAASHAPLDETSLRALKGKMEAIESYVQSFAKP